MQLHISDRNDFLNNFLIPISKVSDSAVLEITEGKIDALLATTDNTIIVSAIYLDTNINISKRLNVPDIKKLCRVLQCINVNEFDLELNNNNISYSSDDVRFKYHLYDDNIISVPKINLSKVNNIEFDCTFSLTPITITSLIKGSTIATETNKIYLTTKDNIIFGDLTDKARANTDSYGLKIADTFEGKPVTQAIPLNFEIFRIISSMKFNNIEGKLASKLGVFTFDTKLGNSTIKFIVSALAN